MKHCILHGRLVEDLVEIASPGAYALFHEVTRVAWVGWGLVGCEALARTVGKLWRVKHPCKKLQELWFVGPVPEGITEWSYSWVPCEDPQAAYRTLYLRLREQGYEVLSQPPKAWRGIVRIHEDPRAAEHGRYVAAVWGKLGEREYVAGVFRHVQEAREWCSINFKDRAAYEAPNLGDDLTGKVGPMLERASRATPRRGSLGARQGGGR